MSPEESNQRPTKWESHEPTTRKYYKYLLLLLLPIIGYSIFQLTQNDSGEQTQPNRPEVIEKALPKETDNPQSAILNNPQKDSPRLSLEKTTDPNANSGTFIDARDAQSYPWVRLKDGKKWLAKNLNYQTTNTWCYDDNQDNCGKYGRLYTWQTANTACPNGWRLPTDDEWWKMASYYGKAYNSYSGQQKMEGPDDGEVAYKTLVQEGDTGFTALFGGSYAANEGFNYLGDLGCYWSSSENNESNALGYYFYIHSRALARDSYHKTLGFSCRCVQD